MSLKTPSVAHGTSITDAPAGDGPLATLFDHPPAPPNPVPPELAPAGPTPANKP